MGKTWILWNLHNWNQPLVKRSPFQHHTKELRETPSVVRDPQLDKLAHFISLNVNSSHCSLLKADTVPHSMRNPPHTHTSHAELTADRRHMPHTTTHTLPPQSWLAQGLSAAHFHTVLCHCPIHPHSFTFTSHGDNILLTPCLTAQTPKHTLGPKSRPPKKFYL